MTNSTIESMKGPIVIVALIAVMGYAIVSGNADQTEKYLAIMGSIATAVGYISSHQAKTLIQAVMTAQPQVATLVGDAEALAPDALKVAGEVETGQPPTLTELMQTYPEVQKMMADIETLKANLTIATTPKTDTVTPTKP